MDNVALVSLVLIVAIPRAPSPPRAIWQDPFRGARPVGDLAAGLEVDGEASSAILPTKAPEVLRKLTLSDPVAGA